MSEPRVLCVCLTRDRPELLARAVRCFDAQTYPHRLLLVFDTSDGHGIAPGSRAEFPEKMRYTVYAPHMAVHPIGAMRNFANGYAKQFGCDLIAHWDDDDISMANRLADQVEFLQRTEAERPGEFAGTCYNQLPFWNREKTTVEIPDTGERFEASAGAWIFQGTFPYPGATFLYRRSLWEQHQFPQKQVGEDTWWPGRDKLRPNPRIAPMICEIHGSNTSTRVRPDQPEWKRREDLDVRFSNAMMEAK